MLSKSISDGFREHNSEIRIPNVPYAASMLIFRFSLPLVGIERRQECLYGVKRNSLWEYCFKSILYAFNVLESNRLRYSQYSIYSEI